MNKKIFRIKAAAGAPDAVSLGNLAAEQQDGFFETDNERFAGFLMERYGQEEDRNHRADESVTENQPAETRKKKDGGKN